jgi:fructose-specific phosphotransferase system IIA component
LVQKSGVVIDLQLTDKLEAIGSMARFVCSVNGLDGAEEVANRILEREEMMSTGIGYGIAIPHARLQGIDRLYMAVARSAAGIEFNSLDGLPVNLIFIMISPANTSTEHTEVLSALSRIMSYEEVRRSLLSAATPDEFLDVLAKAEDKYVGP